MVKLLWWGPDVGVPVKNLDAGKTVGADSRGRAGASRIGRAAGISRLSASKPKSAALNSVGTHIE